MTDRPGVRHSELRDQPNFTGPVLRPDGTLSIYIRSRGLSCGPLAPADLRAFAHQALALADHLETEAEAAGQMALQELAGICGNA